MKFSRLALLALLLLVFLPGCRDAQRKQATPKETTDLRMSVRDFHMKMRWGLWEQAALYTTPDFRPTFEGRFEERGKDYKITDLMVKTVKMSDPAVAEVDVEQSWYKEPDMTLKTERYIEVWLQAGGTWRLSERIEKDEWRQRKKEAQEAKAAEAEAAVERESAEKVDTSPTAGEEEPASGDLDGHDDAPTEDDGSP